MREILCARSQTAGLQVGSPDVLAYNMGWIGEVKTKDYIQKNRFFEYPKPLHSPKWDLAADNITYLEKIAKSNNRTRDASDCITTNDLMENYLFGWQRVKLVETQL